MSGSKNNKHVLLHSLAASIFKNRSSKEPSKNTSISNVIADTCIVLLFNVKMTAVKKVYYTRFAQDIFEHYILMFYEFNSLEACYLFFEI